jgi:ribonuclease G
MSVELQRQISGIFAKQGDQMHELIIVVHPEVLERLRTKDSELLVELERRFNARLTFRADPNFHREQVVFADAKTGKEVIA